MIKIKVEYSDGVVNDFGVDRYFILGFVDKSTGKVQCVLPNLEPSENDDIMHIFTAITLAVKENGAGLKFMGTHKTPVPSGVGNA